MLCLFEYPDNPHFTNSMSLGKDWHSEITNWFSKQSLYSVAETICSEFNKAMCGKSWFCIKRSSEDDCLSVKSSACTRLQHGHTTYTVLPWVQSKRGMNIAKQDCRVNVPRYWICIIHVLWIFLARIRRRSILRQLINETLHNLNIKLTLRVLHWPAPCWIAFKSSGSRWAVFGCYTAYARFKCSFIKVHLSIAGMASSDLASQKLCFHHQKHQPYPISPVFSGLESDRPDEVRRDTWEQPRAHQFDTLSCASCGFINSVKDPGVSKQRCLLRAEVLLSSEVNVQH